MLFLFSGGNQKNRPDDKKFPASFENFVKSLLLNWFRSENEINVQKALQIWVQDQHSTSKL